MSKKELACCFPAQLFITRYHNFTPGNRKITIESVIQNIHSCRSFSSPWLVNWQSLSGFSLLLILKSHRDYLPFFRCLPQPRACPVWHPSLPDCTCSLGSSRALLEENSRSLHNIRHYDLRNSRRSKPWWEIILGKNRRNHISFTCAW